MPFFEKVKCWFKKNKKYVLIGGTVVLTIIGASVGYVVYRNNKFSFPDWLKSASKKDLEDVYEELRIDFRKTGVKPPGMEEISKELGERGAKEWFDKHPPNTNPNFRWTDANRWDND